MPFGSFLDTFPTALFVTVHIILLVFGVWVATTASKKGLPYANAFWLYVIVHLGFLAYLTGIFTIRMSVFLEQVLMFVMVLWIYKKSRVSGQI